MDINLRDYFKIDDSHSKIRGFLIAKDEDGNILVKKENMIVKSGRALILNTLLDSENKLKLKELKAKISEDSRLTYSDMTSMDTLCEDSKGSSTWGILFDDINIVGNDTSITAGETEPVITIGENKNWYFDGVDTNIKAEVPKGKSLNDGYLPRIAKGENNKWFIISDSAYIVDDFIDKDELRIHYRFVIEGFNKNYNANSLGLFYGEGDNETLFSRVVFNTIGLSTNRKVTFHYYIYF